MSKENPSEGANIAEGLDLFFRGGGFGLSSAEPEQPETGPTLPPDVEPASIIGGHIESFVGMISTDRLKKVGGREASKAIRNLFEEDWKPPTLRKLRARLAPSEEVEAVRTLTLKNVSNYAKEKFAFYRKGAATSVPDSPEQRYARERSNYWSIMADFIGPAADPDDDLRFA